MLPCDKCPSAVKTLDGLQCYVYHCPKFDAYVKPIKDDLPFSDEKPKWTTGRSNTDSPTDYPTKSPGLDCPPRR